MGEVSAEMAGVPGNASAVPAAPAVNFAPRHGTIRPLEHRDLEQVARLFLLTFRPDSGKPGRDAIGATAAYMEQLYLRGPYSRLGMNSLVQVDSHGDVGAFLGLLKSRYSLDGEQLSACVLSTLMAAESVEHYGAGQQLLRALNHADFDLLLTDSANRTSLALARPMKYELLPVNCLQWAFAFKPAEMLADKVARKWRRLPASALRPFAQVADALAARLFKTAPRRQLANRHGHEWIDAATFAAIAPRFLSGFRLRPLWPAEEIGWLVEQAAAKRASGPLNFIRVRDGAGAPVGCCAFYGEAGRPAQVLQLLAAEPRWKAVIDSLISAAEEKGCIGVVGQAQEAIMPHLYTYPGLLFYYSGGTMVRSRRKDVVQGLRAREIFVGGLAGDQWTRLSADEFGTS